MGSLERLKPEAQFPRMSLLGSSMNRVNGSPLALLGVSFLAAVLQDSRVIIVIGVCHVKCSTH